MVSISALVSEFEAGSNSYNIPENMPCWCIEKSNPSDGLVQRTVPVPQIGPDEALVAVKSAGLNFNTLWTVKGQPVSSFDFLKRLGLNNKPRASHNLDYHIPGSDASGVVVKLGTDDTNWKVGDSVVLNCNWHRSDDPQVFEDSLLSPEQKIWGYETNYGSLAAFTVVKLHQLMPKPPHLSWTESASYGLVLCTAYRMLMTDHGTRIRPGDRVLIWGGAGGLGLAAIQLCQLVSAIPIPVVSSDEKGQALTKLGVDQYINRTEENLSFWDNGKPDPKGWAKLKRLILRRFGGLPDVVFEHPGRDTMGASVYVLRRGGKVVTCAATTGYDIEYDNRYLWMESKSIIGCHFANAKDSRDANDLVLHGNVRPYVSASYNFSSAREAVDRFEANQGLGKIVVGVLADPKSESISQHNLFSVDDS